MKSKSSPKSKTTSLSTLTSEGAIAAFSASGVTRSDLIELIIEDTERVLKAEQAAAEQARRALPKLTSTEVGQAFIEGLIKINDEKSNDYVSVNPGRSHYQDDDVNANVFSVSGPSFIFDMRVLSVSTSPLALKIVAAAKAEQRYLQANHAHYKFQNSKKSMKNELIRRILEGSKQGQFVLSQVEELSKQLRGKLMSK